jgi:poly-beta-1,6-N-acetyl-D-glucosamine N-deacetylase
MRGRTFSLLASLTVRVLAFAVLALGAAVPAGALWWSAKPQNPVAAQSVTSFPHVQRRWLGTVPRYRGVIVLTLHDVLPNARGRYTLPPSAFAADMVALKAAGLHTISGETFARYVRGEQVYLPPRSILLTFDDGTKGNWIYADPMLRRLRFKAVEFVITGRVGQHQPYYLNWAEVKRMQSSGRWAIGSHTRDGHGFVATSPSGERHASLTNMEWQPGRQQLEGEAAWRSRVTRDLSGSISDILKHKLPRPSLFAFPFSATSTPTNDPAIPRLLAGITDQLFVSSFEDDSDAWPILPHAKGYLHRLEIFRQTDPDRMLAEIRTAARR